LRTCCAPAVTNSSAPAVTNLYQLLDWKYEGGVASDCRGRMLSQLSFMLVWLCFVLAVLHVGLVVLYVVLVDVIEEWGTQKEIQADVTCNR